jgi:hypothetical protein
MAFRARWRSKSEEVARKGAKAQSNPERFCPFAPSRLCEFFFSRVTHGSLTPTLMSKIVELVHLHRPDTPSAELTILPERITDENFQDEIETGMPEGVEVW